MSLFDYFEVPTASVTTEENQAKSSWKFNFETGEFEMSGGNKVQLCDPWTAWAQWCMKNIKTERYACLAYTSDIGLEYEDIRKQTTRQGAEALYEKNVTEALMVHSNTESVLGFTFSWDGDNLSSTFTVIPVEGVPLQLYHAMKL